MTDPEEIKPMLLQLPGEELQEWEVCREVSTYKSQGPQLIEPIGPKENLLF